MARKAFAASVLVVLGAAVLSLFSGSQQIPNDQVRGKNNTVLFLTNELWGLANVHLATAYALLLNHPHQTVHYASFPVLASRVDGISALAKKGNPESPRIIFHPLPGSPYSEAIQAIEGAHPADHRSPPGLKGIDRLCKGIQSYVSPWGAEEYYEIYKAVSQLIDEIDPAVIALDTMLGPGIDAARDKNRVHAFVTPNILADKMPATQPKHTLLWKYPALGSGYPYPVPWHLIPANTYLNYRLIRSFVFMPNVKEKIRYLKAKGLQNPIDFIGVYRPDVPWLTQTLPGAHTPVDVMARNVTLAGPINLAGLEVDSEKHTKLMKWIQKSPTVLISLGSGFYYTPDQAAIMLEAIQEVLLETDVQVLWKVTRFNDFNDDFLKAAVKEMPGRLRIEKWLEIEPPSLLQTGHIVLSVHHGGAGCYHDAIAGGVPQMVLPQWVDLYNYAQIVEDLGIGMWGCRETSPDWTVGCLKSAFLEMLRASPKTAAMRSKAAAFGETARINPGRNVAARELSKLASSGHT